MKSSIIFLNQLKEYVYGTSFKYLNEILKRSLSRWEHSYVYSYHIDYSQNGRRSQK